MAISLLADESYLRALLSRSTDSKRYFLSLQELSPSAKEILKTHQVEQLEPQAWHPLRREELVLACSALVGNINQRMNSRLWWATDFSSKNRFQCRLPDLLENFLRIVETVRSLPDADVIIFPVPWEMHASLRKALSCHVYAPFAEGALIMLRSRLRRISSALYHLGRAFYRWVLCQKELRDTVQRIDPSKKYYVIKSFVYDSSFKGEGRYQDAFFGSLPDFLHGRGENVLFFADILGDLKGCLKKIAACPNAVIVPIDSLSSIGSVVAEHLRVAFYHPQVAGDCFFQDLDVSSLVNRELAAHSGRIQPYQLMQYSQAKTLIERTSIKTFLTPYENNPWEKMCIMALRDSSPQTKIFAYQHNVTPEASLNMFNSSEDQDVIPRADKVLVVGDIAKGTIEHFSTAKLPPVEVSAALRLEYLFKLQPRPRPRDGTILLGLEGIFEVHHLVNYVLSQIKKNETRRIIIRTHPVLPVSRFAHKLIAPLTDYPCIEISQGKTVAEDINRSDLMIYWGSTVALEALWMGRPVIHFDMGRMLNFDPVVGECPLRWSVNRQDPLWARIAQIEQMGEESMQEKLSRTSDYIKNYFHPPTSDRMLLFLPQ